MNYQELSKEELIELLETYEQDPTKNLKLSLTKQLNHIAQQISVLEIDITDPENKKLLDLIIKLSETGSKIATSMKTLGSGDKKEALDLGDGFIESLKRAKQ